MASTHVPTLQSFLVPRLGFSVNPKTQTTSSALPSTIGVATAMEGYVQTNASANIKARITGAPKWDEAPQKFSEEGPGKYAERERGLAKHAIRAHGSTLDVSELRIPGAIIDKPRSREIVSRLKRWLPDIAALKGTVMPIAALKPHKITPICCAFLFGIAEVRSAVKVMSRLTFVAPKLIVHACQARGTHRRESCSTGHRHQNRQMNQER